MRVSNAIKLIAVLTILGLPLFFTAPAFAAPTAEVQQAQNFIQTIAQVLGTIAGSIAVIFIIIGGYTYTVSSGDPEKLDKAKRTILFSAIGLVVVIAAFAISSFVTGAAKGAFGG